MKNSDYKPLIFIAEDIPKNLQVLCNILKRENYRIAAAGNGKQALQMIPFAKPDLILLDVMMPEMNGFEVCQRLQEIPEISEIPIIFLTARTEKSDVVKGFKIGGVDYVTKPFNGAELLSRVKSHLELKFAKEALRDLNATKDTFFSIIAHDLKDPMQCLMLYADSLYHSYDSLNEEKKRDYIGKFYSSTQQLSSLLQNLLTWSQTQKGTIQCRPQRIEMRALVMENIDLFREHAAKKNISLSAEIDTTRYALADKNMICTVLRNLVSNALKFTGNGGQVKVTMSEEYSVPNGKEMLKVTVSDDGVGIAADDISKLFRIGDRKSTIGTAKEKGTGLGLILCREFIEQNNGTIHATSEPGRGSTFTFTLPKWSDENV